MRNEFALPPEDGDVLSNPPFDPRRLRTIELAVREAWRRVLANQAIRHLYQTAHETQFTDWLVGALHDLLEDDKTIPDYNPDVFQRSQMGSEFLDLSRRRFKKPDFNFGLCGRKRPGVRHFRYDYIFVECKLITQGGANVADYLNEGVFRFVYGQYAWAMREAMMVAFVRTSQSLPQALESELQKLARAGQLPQQTRAQALNTSSELRRCNLTRAEPPVYISVHDRHWSYFAPVGVPGPITLRHLWLKVS